MTEKQNNDSAVANKPRRISGIVLLGIVVLGFAAFSFRIDVSSVPCTEDTLTPKPDVIMLGAWWCTYCYQARRYFQINEISYCEYDIEQTYEGKRLYEKLNGRAIPVILIGNHQLNGFDEQTIERMLSELHTS